MFQQVVDLLQKVVRDAGAPSVKPAGRAKPLLQAEVIGSVQRIFNRRSVSAAVDNDPRPFLKVPRCMSRAIQLFGLRELNHLAPWGGGLGKLHGNLGDDPGLTTLLLREWQRRDSKSRDLYAWQAKCALKAGAYGAAIRAAQKAPRTATSRDVLRDAQRRLHEEAGRYPLIPREGE